ncbi:hypothetical protein [Methylobacterium sp. 1973]|uniref:hypothetical protein n=1 Tax=Methylobacterium sp. 1973 TaxID=3156421 RepID=UPI0033957A75
MAEASNTAPAETHPEAEQADNRLWYMHIQGPDDVHAAPDFWTALAWAAELNTAIAQKAAKENWAADGNYPHTQAVVRRWTWSATEHATMLARELAERQEHAEKRAAALKQREASHG